ncbi:hypothetical protein FA95DRAFT_1606274 [Auriscalpium vulgare]|uniref:Uncharacterized protein n=1 Tax=Auriscalpium vulgare TaxID=40419 RepID=A0ACB8RST8_9AGAM|nr:hypothetical protein FA95DRAFT_1606274 [Auriscalpium vulgare]
MTNWNNPEIIAKLDGALVKLVHVAAGLEIWEIVTTSGFELDMILGNRPYQWTVWVYTGCRLSMLAALAIFVATKDIDGLGDCTAWDASIYTFSYISLGLASLLILLRVAALWRRNILVMTITSVVWLTASPLTSAVGRAVLILSGQSSPCSPTKCIPVDSGKAVVSVIGVVVSDVVLLGFMLAGILRHRVQDVPIPGGGGGLWLLLWNQGLIWLGLAIFAEVPALVVISMNLNDPWNVMFEIVTGVTLSIGATRMFRILSNYRPSDESSPYNVTQGTHVDRGFVGEAGGKAPARVISISLELEDGHEVRAANGYAGDIVPMDGEPKWDMDI